MTVMKNSINTQKENIIAMWNSGMTVKEIAKSLSVSVTGVERIIWTFRMDGHDVRKHHFDSTKLLYDIYSNEQYICSGTAKEVSSKLGVKESTVKCWATPSFHKRHTGNQKGYIAYKAGEKE